MVLLHLPSSKLLRGLIQKTLNETNSLFFFNLSTTKKSNNYIPNNCKYLRGDNQNTRVFLLL